MFIDFVELTVSSGKGGAGCVSFWTEKFVVKGGPDGGDGGKGGSVYFRVDNNTDTLSWYRGKRHLKAKNGRPGEGRKRFGKKGEDLELVVPPGTQVIDVETGEVLLDLVDPGERVLFLKGGKGGLGNVHFKSPSNQRPTYAQPGEPGVTKHIRLELKSIADVGLVGFPNVGKSTLISTLSNAKPQVADYEFTTLTPKVGVVKAGEFDAFIMADIPGIIEGASEGRGLGLDFLRHIERTRTLLLMIDASNWREPGYQYDTLRSELARYSEALSRRHFAVALSKIDALDVTEVNARIASMLDHLGLKENDYMQRRFAADTRYLSYGYESDVADMHMPHDAPLFLLPLSSAAHINTEALRFALHDLVSRQRNAKEAACDA